MGKDNKKRSIEEIKSVFEQAGYKLLSTEYINNVSPLWILCPNNHKSETTWSYFSQGVRCKQGYCDKRRISFEKVKETFEKKGYVLLSTKYENTHTPLKTLCLNKHVYWVSFANFTSQHGYGKSEGRKGCRQCSYERLRLDEKQVQQSLLIENYRMLSKYKNCHTKFKIECSEGHVYDTTWDIFKSGCRCPVCANERWVSEAKLGEIIRQLYPNFKIRPQDNLEFLGQQHVDFSIRELSLAFEYDGEQHFKPVCFGGISKARAKENFIKTKRWDKRKNKLCKKNGLTLIRIKYDEDLNTKSIEHKIQTVLAQSKIPNTLCASPKSVDSEKL